MDKHNVADYLKHLGAKVPSRGNGWRKMKCPFHDDSNASAAINFDANRFKCFGCEVSGDIYDLIKHERGGTLSEAIEFAQTISTTSDATVRIHYKPSGRLLVNKGAIGRRGQAVSSGRSRRTSTES